MENKEDINKKNKKISEKAQKKDKNQFFDQINEGDNLSQNNIQDQQKKENEEKEEIIFRLKRRPNQIPLENLLLDNAQEDIYEQLLQNKKVKQNSQITQIADQKQQDEELKFQAQQIKQNQDIDKISNIFSKFDFKETQKKEENKQQKNLESGEKKQQENGQNECNTFILKRVKDYYKDEKGIQNFREDIRGNVADNARKQQLNQKRQKIIDLCYDEDKKKLVLFEKDSDLKKKQQNIIGLNENKENGENNKKEIIISDEVEDFYILENDKTQNKLQLENGQMYQNGQKYQIVSFSKNLIPYLKQNQYGQEIVCEQEGPNSDHDSEDSNRSSNPNNTYPSSEYTDQDQESGNDEQFENFEEDLENENSNDDYENYDDDQNNSEIDEEHYYMKKQGINKANNKKYKQNYDFEEEQEEFTVGGYYNDDDDFYENQNQRKGKSQKKQPSTSQLLSQFKTYLNKQKDQRKNLEDFDYDNF